MCTFMSARPIKEGRYIQREYENKIITIFIYFICLETLGKLEIIINKTSITKLAIKIVFFLYRSQY